MSSTTDGDGRLPATPLLASPRDKIEHGRMMSISSKIFSSDENDFRIIDIFDNESGQKFKSYTCGNANASSVLSNPDPNTRIRLISIPALGTVLPLSITFPLMHQIMIQYGIEQEFWDILYSFGTAPHAAEGGSTHAFARSYPEGSRACCYELQYVEENHRTPFKPWSDRHTGIYHRSWPHGRGESQKPFDLFVLLHPTMDTIFEQQVLAITRPNEVGKALYARLCADPNSMHELLLESYLGNWRWFIRSRGDEFQKSNDDLFTFDMPEAKPESLGFEPVRHFRHMRDRVITAKAYCQGNMAVIELLKALRGQQNGFDTTAAAMAERVRGYLTGLATLEARMDNSISLLEYSLSLKNESTAADMNKHVVELTHSTVDDSATVKIITIFSLIYLPGTFISGLYGMNFFVFDQSSWTFAIATDFWIFVATWLPLTGVTMAVYWYVDWRRRMRVAHDAPGMPTRRVEMSMGEINMRKKGLRSWPISKKSSGAPPLTLGRV